MMLVNGRASLPQAVPLSDESLEKQQAGLLAVHERYGDSEQSRHIRARLQSVVCTQVSRLYASKSFVRKSPFVRKAAQSEHTEERGK